MLRHAIDRTYTNSRLIWTETWMPSPFIKSGCHMGWVWCGRSSWTKWVKTSQETRVTSTDCQFLLLLLLLLLFRGELTTKLSVWDLSSGKFVLLSPEKPAATEPHYPTYRARWVFQCFHNPPNSDMDYKIFNVCKNVNACKYTRGVYGHRKGVCNESCLW